VPGVVTRSAIAAASVVALLLGACATAKPAPQPHAAPRPGYQMHDTRTMGALTVERWVPSTSPEVSPAGMCECITLVYLGDRKVLTLGEPDLMTATTVEATSGTDITGDSVPEIVVSTWSGGAHCCYSTSIHSVGTEAKPILTIETGNCGPGELRDLDSDGSMEVVTCDDRWAYTYCSFADSPFPRVVLAYSRARNEYEVATPRYAAHLRDDIAAQTAEARTRMASEGGKDPGIDMCTVLQPALSLMYIGDFDAGRSLIRDLYRGTDRDTFERDVIEGVRASRLWVER
jgi:hypothetical protein